MADNQKTMTLNLPEAEYNLLTEFAEKWDMSKTAVLRKAVRQLQFVERIINTHGQTMEVLIRREFPPKALPFHASAFPEELCPTCLGWGNSAEVVFTPCTTCDAKGYVRTA